MRCPPARCSRACLASAGPLHRPMLSLLQTARGRLRLIGFLEGVSFLVLLGIAMPLKYYADSPGAVRVVGMAHGVLFVLYVLAAIQATVEYRWSWKTAGLLFAAAFLPCGPFIADAKLLRSATPASAPEPVRVRS